MKLPDGGFLDSPEEWDALVAEVRRAGVCGLDTEFYGVDPSEKSCVGRARVHVFSIAIRTDRLSPLGFHHCRGWCLPERALDRLSVVELLEDCGVRKEIHNQSVDHHALSNHGITVGGGRNTLGLIRWSHPGLVNNPGRFQLKALMGSLLRRSPICTFKQLVGYEREETVTKIKTVKVKACACGETGCRKRKPERIEKLDGPRIISHEKIERMESVHDSRIKNVKDQYPLETIVPGHPRWDLLVKYAVEDAVAALQIAEIADEARNPAQFPYESTPRPSYSQELEDAVIAMEQVGFRVDVPWCTETAARAEADEEKELVWLFRWYVANAPTYGPHHRKLGLASKQAKKRGVDCLWSSPAKKIVLFDRLGFPRSPVWAKGKVKRGEVKLDWKAMAWIANNWPEAKQVCEHLLKLARIRSGKKYLVKLRDSGGMVHPICGPAGDDDDRSGAVTGRLGIKGELEAQQLPTDEDKDLYLVRKAIIA